MRQRPERLRLCRLFRLFRSPLTQSEQLNAALGAGVPIVPDVPIIFAPVGMGESIARSTPLLGHGGELRKI